jgi:hypothetical protein
MVDGVSGSAENYSERATAKRIGIRRKTVSKKLRHSVPTDYPREAPPVSPKLGPFPGMVNRILLGDRDVLKKPRHTAVRNFECLRDEHGYPSGYTVVREFAAKERLRQQEVLSLWRIRPAALNSSCHSFHLNLLANDSKSLSGIGRLKKYP